MQKNIISVLALDFLVAVAVAIAASAIIAFILTNLVLGWFKKS